MEKHQVSFSAEQIQLLRTSINSEIERYQSYLDEQHFVEHDSSRYYYVSRITELRKLLGTLPILSKLQ